MVDENNETEENQLKDEVDKNPNSLETWQNLIRYYIKHGIAKEVERATLKGIQAVPDQSLPLWQALITYYSIPRELREDSYDPSKIKIETIYQQGSQFSINTIADEIRCDYLHWLVAEQSLRQARNKFIEFSTRQKPSYKLIKTMIVLEERNIKANPEVIQKLWEMSCNFYGDDPDPWINLVKHHWMQTGCTYENAIKDLKKHKDMIEAFVENYRQKKDKFLNEFT